MSDRDEKLRHSLLTAARLIGASKQGGFVSATLLAESARDDNNVRVDSDDHAERLLLELCDWGLLEGDSNEHLSSAPRSFRHRRFRLTNKGRGLFFGDVPPVPGVWDQRLDEG